jgi:hypothetical protein
MINPAFADVDDVTAWARRADANSRLAPWSPLQFETLKASGIRRVARGDWLVLMWLRSLLRVVSAYLVIRCT